MAEEHSQISPTQREADEENLGGAPGTPLAVHPDGTPVVEVPSMVQASADSIQEHVTRGVSTTGDLPDPSCG